MFSLLRQATNPLTTSKVGVISEQADPLTIQDYNLWLTTVEDIAAEGGVNIATKRSFADVALDVLDNDPLVDTLTDGPGSSEKIKSNIVDILWRNFQIKQASSKVTSDVRKSFNKAAEDEQTATQLVGYPSEDEQLGHFAQLFRQKHGIEDEQLMKDSAIAHEVEKARGPTNPYQPGTLRASIWDNINGKSTEDEQLLSPDASEFDQPAMPVEDRIEDLEHRVADLETAPHAPAAEDDPESIAYHILKTKPLSQTHAVQDEESSRTIFHAAITAPRQHMVDALKDVQDTGEAAWVAVNIPKNPHPKTTPAHKAWSKGFKAAAGRELGFAPPVSVDRSTKGRGK